MAWKKKEKPLTPEEAVAQAKKELAPLWFGSEPLLAGIMTEAGASVFPLNPGFLQTPWVLAFIDPTEFAGERAIEIVREWHRRYSPHKMGFIIAFRAPVPFLKSAPDLLRRYQIQFPATLDQDGVLAQAFRIQSWPGVVVQSWARGPAGGPEEIARGSGAAWTDGVEEKTQVFLRRTDPGLSLPLPYALKNPVIGKSRVDFGTAKGKPVSSLGQVIELQGSWKESEDCISTSDPSAAAIVQASSPVFSLIARSSIETQVTKILIEPADGALVAEWIPDGVAIDENGRGVARIQLFGLYDILMDLPANRRRVKMTFPDADTVPIQIYGLRFGATS